MAAQGVVCLQKAMDMLRTGRKAVVKPVDFTTLMLPLPMGRSMHTSTMVMMTAVVMDKQADNTR